MLFGTRYNGAPSPHEVAQAQARRVEVAKEMHQHHGLPPHDHGADVSGLSAEEHDYLLRRGFHVGPHGEVLDRNTTVVPPLHVAAMLRERPDAHDGPPSEKSTGQLADAIAAQNTRAAESLKATARSAETGQFTSGPSAPRVNAEVTTVDLNGKTSADAADLFRRGPLTQGREHLSPSQGKPHTAPGGE
jgi:hypothetical protein